MTSALAALIEGMLDAVWLVDAASLRVVAANAAAGTLMGVAADELCGREIAELAATPEDLCFWDDVASGLADHIESDTLARRVNGGTVPVTRRVSRFEHAPGAPLFIVTLHDRSEQRRIEDELEERLAELSATLESTADGILVTDLAGNIRSFNHRFATLWDVPDALLKRRDDDAVLAWMRRSVVDPAGYMRRLASIDESTTLQTSDTISLHCGTVLERVTLPQRSRGRPIGRVYSFRDITERVEAMRRIDTLSHTEPLTGLPNRRVLVDRVAFALALAAREGTPFALLLVNLDHFKQVNDTLGRAVGDRVLIDVAQRLKSCLRQVDTVACLGGDEFVLLLHAADPAGTEITARRVLEAVQCPFTESGVNFTVTCSIGVALHPCDGANLDELLRHSGGALQEVKQAGRAAFRFHQPGRDLASVHGRTRLELDHAMRQALANGHFRLHYQPLVDIHSAELRGAEALIRWRDPQLGDVTPGEFIPVAEESGLIVAIGDWVLRSAVHQAAQWRALGHTLTVSVNVSALQFQRPGFVDRVAAVLHTAGLPPEGLELELTESILLQDANEALRRLQALAQLGVKLAIDDFGTGYSSLGYLKRFPIHRLKIDRSFVRGLPGDASDAGIAHAIVDLARALRLEVVAEGVETEAQRQFLLNAGCTQYQGFLFAPALPTADFEQLLDQPQRPRAVLRAVH